MLSEALPGKLQIAPPKSSDLIAFDSNTLPSACFSVRLLYDESAKKGAVEYAERPPAESKQTKKHKTFLMTLK
jgi:hypothetical protein